VSVEAPVPELKPVVGPRAIGGGRRRFFDLLWLVSLTDFKKVYFGTVLGYLWSLMRPLFLFAVLLFVFTKIFNFGSVPNYPVRLLLNLMLFTFFQEVTAAAVVSVVQQEGIVRKTQFPRLVIPLSVVCTGIFNLLLNLIAVFAFIFAYGVDPTWTWVLLPVVLLVLAVLTTAVAMILSVLYVRFRDIAIIWGVFATALFYATPILYPLEEFPQYAKALSINPLTPIFVQVNQWIINPDAPGAATVAGGWVHLLPAAAIYVAVCAFAVWIFNHDSPRIAEEL
jgi:ABC-2 type transport system permease protein